ncbi:eukaryotic initiation factor 4E domain-containing protein [Phthorimaea operculella]|nr:eukaryotic initiation factor 4E domain-containing protein [Phthorimaea operculella]
MTERKMCKFYNLNVPERRSGEGGAHNHGGDEEDRDRHGHTDDASPPPVPPHEHKLEYSYWMWFSRRPPARELSASSTGYGQALRLVGRVATVEQWWGLYSHLARPSELPPLSDLHLFKLGIKPMWEDPANVNGGKWSVRVVGLVATVEQWWGLYSHLARPSELPPLSDLHLFKLGIKPMWEDPANVNGGKWSVRVVGLVATVEQWWGLYSHLARPSELPPLSDLHLFKLGIKPIWEDPANVNGGKWSVRVVGLVATVEQWWGLYSHLARPSELPPLSDLHLFKLGIKPMWEDPANVNGGKWSVRVVGLVATVEQWWGLYSHLARPSELPPLSDLHLFKLGIKPMWEDPANVNGGKWSVRVVGLVATVEQWWGLYSHLARPSELPPLSDLHLFKLGIKPMWEDPANVNGGKWVVRLRKSATGRAWEDLCMAMLGEQFMVGAELCGVVLSVRFQEDHLAVWHRTASDTMAAARVRDALRRILQLPPSVPIEYKAHGDCLRASASRNDHSEANDTGPHPAHPGHNRAQPEPRS